MKSNNLILAVLVLTLGVVGCQKKKEPIADTAAKTISGLKTDATTTAKDLKNAAQDAKADVEKAAAQAKKDAEAAASKMAEEGKKLLASAQSLLEKEKYEEALKSAQQMVSEFGADSDIGKQAQGIITKAKAKIQKAAAEQADALKTGLSDKLKTLGQ